MKQFFKCLTIVALVATFAYVAQYHEPTLASHTPTPTAAKRDAAAIAKTKSAEPAKVAPATTPTPALDPAPVVATPAPVVYPAGCANYVALVRQYDWNVNTAMAIMQAENTNCDPAKDNAGLNRDGTVDYGLFQVNSIHADMVGGNLESLRTPAVNVAIAYKLSHNGTSWTAWSTFNNGRYLAYLK